VRLDVRQPVTRRERVKRLPREGRRKADHHFTRNIALLAWRRHSAASRQGWSCGGSILIDIAAARARRVRDGARHATAGPRRRSDGIGDRCGRQGHTVKIARDRYPELDRIIRYGRKLRPTSKCVCAEAGNADTTNSRAAGDTADTTSGEPADAASDPPQLRVRVN
jgi:hypothetical protein